MEDQVQANPLEIPWIGRRWVVPHALLTLLSLALPIIKPDVWDWWTATGGVGFFGSMLVFDLLATSRSKHPAGVRTPLPGEPVPKQRTHPAVWLAMMLLLVAGLTMIYVVGMRTGFWRPT